MQQLTWKAALESEDLLHEMQRTEAQDADAPKSWYPFTL